MANDLELLVRSYTDQIQELDSAAADVLPLTSISGAEGIQLDGLGEIIGIERNGLTDENYRSLLSAYVRINASTCTIDELNEIIRLASNTTVADAHFTLIEGSPAEFVVEFTPTLAAGVGEVVADAVYAAKAAGVHAVTIFRDTDPPFAFDGDGSSAFDGGYYLRHAIRNRGRRESEVN